MVDSNKPKLGRKAKSQRVRALDDQRVPSRATTRKRRRQSGAKELNLVDENRKTIAEDTEALVAAPRETKPPPQPPTAPAATPPLDNLKPSPEKVEAASPARPQATLSAESSPKRAPAKTPSSSRIKTAHSHSDESEKKSPLSMGVLFLALSGLVVAFLISFGASLLYFVEQRQEAEELTARAVEASAEANDKDSDGDGAPENDSPPDDKDSDGEGPDSNDGVKKQEEVPEPIDDETGPVRIVLADDISGRGALLLDDLRKTVLIGLQRNKAHTAFAKGSPEGLVRVSLWIKNIRVKESGDDASASASCSMSSDVGNNDIITSQAKGTATLGDDNVAKMSDLEIASVIECGKELVRKYLERMQTTQRL